MVSSEGWSTASNIVVTESRATGNKRGEGCTHIYRWVVCMSVCNIIIVLLFHYCYIGNVSIVLLIIFYSQYRRKEFVVNFLCYQGGHMTVAWCYEWSLSPRVSGPSGGRRQLLARWPVWTEDSFVNFISHIGVAYAVVANVLKTAGRMWATRCWSLIPIKTNLMSSLVVVGLRSRYRTGKGTTDRITICA